MHSEVNWPNPGNARLISTFQASFEQVAFQALPYLQTPCTEYSHRLQDFQIVTHTLRLIFPLVYIPQGSRCEVDIVA